MIGLMLLLAASQPGTLGCIDPRSVLSRRAEGADTIIFDMLGGRQYRNRLRAACPGLEQAGDASTLAIEQKGAMLCQGDFVRVIRAGNAGVTCILGRFEELPKKAVK